MNLSQFYYMGEMPYEFGPDCWIPAAEALWLRRELKNVGIQSRLIPTPVHGFAIVQALPDLPRPAQELFCPPELDDV